ncbi:hypothetical protein BM43_4979 [Burkholderia gladioli]|jgi:hypothetical protein|uniref:Uncharacterized protein n=1 Tax=Burkholderia gladioli TaxID=28095 RepID=A0AAW3F2E9_BURGA|nr:hypothetical protein BM43_4979 [Burkholderia gladioli]KGC14666.1 hypothetical protein DM48_2787 [Burkholderia gladioli]SQA90981.1 Uncharacterised protein [Burkholderia gladioli]
MDESSNKSRLNANNSHLRLVGRHAAGRQNMVGKAVCRAAACAAEAGACGGAAGHLILFDKCPERRMRPDYLSPLRKSCVGASHRFRCARQSAPSTRLRTRLPALSSCRDQSPRAPIGNAAKPAHDRFRLRCTAPAHVGLLDARQRMRRGVPASSRRIAGARVGRVGTGMVRYVIKRCHIHGRIRLTEGTGLAISGPRRSGTRCRTQEDGENPE